LDKELLPVTCIDLELSIMREFDYRRNVIVPNVSSQMNIVAFETDILVITKNNMAYGFEIKVSKSDLRADFKKPHHTMINENMRGKTGMEHFFGKFKYFYYVVPEQLKEEALLLIPEFCGLWCLKKHNNGKRLIHESILIKYFI